MEVGDKCLCPDAEMYADAEGGAAQHNVAGGLMAPGHGPDNSVL